MELVLNVFARGARFTVYALEEHAIAGEHNPPNRPLLEFLNELEQDDANEHARMMRRLEWAAQNGPPLNNKEQCRHLEGDIYEFKTRGGTRVLWFYDAGHLIICSHGFGKQGQKTPRREIDRAQEWKQKYDAARRRRPLRIIEDDQI